MPTTETWVIEFPAIGERRYRHYLEMVTIEEVICLAVDFVFYEDPDHFYSWMYSRMTHPEFPLAMGRIFVEHTYEIIREIKLELQYLNDRESIYEFLKDWQLDYVNVDRKTESVYLHFCTR